MKAISLFAGMGGDTLGLEDAGVKVVAFSEKNKDAIESHLVNFPESKLIGDGDITKTTDKELSSIDADIIFAGFPCQGFSQAGKKLPDDPRNTLFVEFLRATRLIKPEIIIGENVKGLLTRKTAQGENYIDVIVSEFTKIGYDVKYGILKSEEHGVPQKRQRLFIVGTLKENTLSTKTINKIPYIDLPTEDEIGLRDFIEPTLEKSEVIKASTLDLSNKGCKVIEASGNKTNPHPYLSLKLSQNVNHYWNGDSYEYKGKTYDSLFSFSKRDSPIHCEVVDIDRPAKTIICTYASQPRMFVPVKHNGEEYLRSFTVKELKQIQSFPKDFIVKGSEVSQIAQIGNAVPPKLCTKLVKEILNADSKV
jgi:DNA (cytosine-5)-methyltransferase 1